MALLKSGIYIDLLHSCVVRQHKICQRQFNRNINSIFRGTNKDRHTAKDLSQTTRNIVKDNNMTMGNTHTLCINDQEIHAINHSMQNVIQVRHLSTFFPWKKKKSSDMSEEDEIALENVTKRKQMPDDQNMKKRLNYLATKSKLHNRKDYRPPPDMFEKIENILKEFGVKEKVDWSKISFTDRRNKFEILTQMMEEFQHNIPASTLSNMHSIATAAEYFNTPVYQTTGLEEISQKSDLPKNLSINLDYTRFDPDNDPLFDGKTAYPGQDTIVSSIKYKRVYKDIKTRIEKPGYANHYENY